MSPPRQGTRGSRRGVLAVLLGIYALTAAIERWNGRTLFCRCGRIRLWSGIVHGPENSQQFADWYSAGHVVHGLLLYGAARLLLGRTRRSLRIVVAALVEAAWEVCENSAPVIARYRAETVSWGYSGDSVLNSLGDLTFMLAGFALTARVPVRTAVLVGVALEALSLIAIRDNLTLNVLMLVHPIAAVRAWQGG